MGLYTRWLSESKRPEVLFQYQSDSIRCGLLPLMEDGSFAYFWYNDVYLGLTINPIQKEVHLLSLNGTTIMDANGKSVWMEVLVSLFSKEWQFRYEQTEYINEADVRTIQRICQDNPMYEKNTWNMTMYPQHSFEFI